MTCTHTRVDTRTQSTLHRHAVRCERATADAERVTSLSSELGAARARSKAAEAEVARLESTLAKERQERRAAEEAAAGRAAGDAAGRTAEQEASAEAPRVLSLSFCGAPGSPAHNPQRCADTTGVANALRPSPCHVVFLACEPPGLRGHGVHHTEDHEGEQ